MIDFYFLHYIFLHFLSVYFIVRKQQQHFFFCKHKRDKQTFEGQSSWNSRRALHSSNGQAYPRTNKPVPKPVSQQAGEKARSWTWTIPEAQTMWPVLLLQFIRTSSWSWWSYSLSPEDAFQTYLQNFAHIPSPCTTLPQVLRKRNLHGKVLDHFLKPLWHII